MEARELFAKIDHTLLKATATWQEITVLCEEAVQYHTASVCIPSCYVEAVHRVYGDKLTICTVIGFPLGYCVTEAKLAELRQAKKDGAAEFDMVINISDLKNGKVEKVMREIAALKKEAGNLILKVIVETCYLTEGEKIAVCKAVTDAGADYIKTSTGFGTGGATLADVELFKRHIGPNVKIKAAGGIKSVADLEQFIAAGCSRIGTSSAVKLLSGGAAESY